MIVGFEFYIAHSQITGITLFDIKFQGEPIVYEVRNTFNAPSCEYELTLGLSLDYKKQWLIMLATILSKETKYS